MANLSKRLFPLQITKRFYLWMVFLIIIPIIILAVITQLEFLRERKIGRETELLNVAIYMDKQLSGSFDEILRQQNALDKPLEEQVLILNDALQPVITDMTLIHPFIGVGYYSIKHDSVVAIGPGFDPSMLVRRPHTLATFRVYETGKPELFYVGDTVGWRGKPVLSFAYPIYRNGEIIGHTWANVKMEDVYAEAWSRRWKILLAGPVILGAVLIISWVVFRRFKIDLENFASAATNDNFNLPEDAMPELKSLLGVIKDRTLQLQHEITNRLKAENELKKKVEEQELLLDNIEIIVWYYTDIETYGTVNRAHEDFFDLPKKDTEGKSLYQIVNREVADICIAFNREVFESKKQVRTEEWTMNAKGENRLLSVIKTPKLDENGCVEYIIGTAYDITEQKRAENELKISEERYRRITDNMLDMIRQINVEGIIQYASPSHKNILGYAPEDLLGKSIFEFFHPDDKNRVVMAFQRSLRSSTSFKGKDEYRIRHANGQYLWVSTTGNLLFDDNGLIIGAVFCSREITERKLAEEALRESEGKYRTLVEQIPAIIYVSALDEISTTLYVSPQVKAFLGFSQADYKAGSGIWRKQLHPDDRERVLGEVALCHTNNEPFVSEYRMLTREGHILWFHDEARFIKDDNGRPLFQQGVMINITKRKSAEEKLEAERQRLFSLLDGLPAIVYLIAPDYSIRFSNRYFWERFGKPEKRPCYEILSNRKEPCKKCPTFRVFDTKLPQDWEDTLLDGRTYQNYAYPFTEVDGFPMVLVLGIDITDRKRAEEALRLSEVRFFKAFNSSPFPMTIITFRDGRFIEMNNSFLDVYGYHREEVIGRTAIELKLWAKPEDRAVMIQILNEKGSVQNLEINFCIKSGEIRVGLLSAEIIDLNGEQCLLTVVNDITERKQFENEMARLDRLNLVGEMAAGIGHEVRNPMTTVRGFLQLLAKKEECSKHNEYFNLMIEELDRANSIISEYLSLAKNKAVELKVQNLKSIVENLFPLIQADAMVSDKYINLEFEDTPDLPLDEKEIRQLILNLVRNGLQAMSSSGKLNIRTYVANEEVVLAVQDDGNGIEPDVFEKIGTPFFTTKDNGTGLGLAVCYSIAARHNAKIEVETGPKGTTFYVLFKLVPGP